MGKKTSKKDIKKENKKETSKASASKSKTKQESIDPEVDKIEIEISKEKELQDKVDEINDKYLRLYSEFDNYRKRTSKEKLELSKTASENVIIELLPVLDDFERAIKSTEDSNDCAAVKDGINLIHSKFKSVLTKKGLTAIESIGKEFDTDFHEAITQIPAPSKKLKGKVVDEVEKGYLLNEKVIRFSKVVTGK
ncbi:MAG: nucleotide exchange factor GrpE [Bacteroidetes bacterium]|nr:MAG: nucleotide exchange factor GrpE [Bacteroidota bacterium]